ncbi:unnamed protein product [Meloidogyne enterolobii]
MRVSGETLRYELLDEWDEELITSIEEFDLGRYHRYNSIIQYMQLIAKENPKIAKFESIGKTTELRELGVLKVNIKIRSISTMYIYFKRDEREGEADHSVQLCPEKSVGITHKYL